MRKAQNRHAPDQKQAREHSAPADEGQMDLDDTYSCPKWNRSIEKNANGNHMICKAVSNCLKD
jgi:hypothetical protein